MSDFFYPDRRSIYFTSLNDPHNSFHYLANYYKINSYGLIREEGLTKSPAFNKYMHALQVLKKSLTDSQGKVLYEGIVEVTVPKGTGKFEYYISMQNESYSVSTDKGNIDSKIVSDRSEKTAATTCEGYSD